LQAFKVLVELVYPPDRGEFVSRMETIHARASEMEQEQVEAAVKAKLGAAWPRSCSVVWLEVPDKEEEDAEDEQGDQEAEKEYDYHMVVIVGDIEAEDSGSETLSVSNETVGESTSSGSNSDPETP
jgi:disulfide oxidoreductase YuzD